MKRQIKYSCVVVLLFFLSACTREDRIISSLGGNGSQNKTITYVRSLDEAKELAIAASYMLGNDTKSSDRVFSDQKCIFGTSTKSYGASVDTLMYVFNYEDNEGFVIINANKRMDPFVCIVEEGHFFSERNNGNPAFDQYIHDVKEIIQQSTRFVEDPGPIDSLGGPGLELYKYKVNRYVGSYKTPLLNTKWGQEDEYGAYCPNGVSGCVATAMGQIMAYHQYPSSITASINLGNYSQGQNISMHWYNIGFHKKTHTGYQSCSDYHSEISALLRDIGAQVFMEYGVYGSGASPSMIPSAFIHYGYSTGSLASANVSTIKTSLDNNRPVLMGGSSSSGGHAWVADGYKDYLLYEDTYAQAYPQPGYYLVQSEFIEEVHALHINWGWDGICNGYFNFNYYNSADAVSYDNNSGMAYDFDTDILMIANIHK